MQVKKTRLKELLSGIHNTRKSMDDLSTKELVAFWYQFSENKFYVKLTAKLAKLVIAQFPAEKKKYTKTFKVN